MAEPEKVTINLNLNGIGDVALSSARETVDVVGLALQLMEEAGPDAVGKHQSVFVKYDFGRPTGTSADRYKARRHWLLTKGFQDITLATRRALEEADHILDIASSPQGVIMTMSELEERFEASRRAGNKAALPALMERVQKRISSKIEYSEEILSLNRARNCLEHRRGIVAREDCDVGKDYLSVTYPRMVVFYVYDGREIEIDGPHQLPDDPNVKTIPLMMQLKQRQFRFSIGDAIVFSASDFAEITFAVWFFATDLVKKVAKSPIIVGIASVDLGSTG